MLLWSGTWLAGDRTRLRPERMAELEERALRAEREAERERRLAAAEERMRIARDLHDSAGHAINVILVHAGAGRLQVERDPAAAREAFQTIEDVARETVGEIDQMVGALREDGARPRRWSRRPGSRRSTAWWSATAPPAWTSRRRSSGDRGRCRRPSTAAPTASSRRRSPTPPATGMAARSVDLAVGRRTRSSSRSPTRSAAAGRGRDAGGHGVIGMRERAALLGGSLEAGAAQRELRGARAAAARGPRAMSEPPVRVLIVDDDDLMRAGLRGVLSSDDAIEVVGEASDGRDAVYRTRLLNPDVVLMDVRMPDLDGISATRELLADFPEVRVVILTTFEQDDYIFGALAAGASGFLLKRTAPGGARSPRSTRSPPATRCCRRRSPAA